MDLEELLTIQDGVISRAQVLVCGGEDHDIRRRLRRREWATLVAGVYVHHTGDPTWEQRAVAGVLHAASGLDGEGRPLGAALGGHAALRHAIGAGWRRGAGGPIEICIDERRSLRRISGYRFVRVAHLKRPGRQDADAAPIAAGRGRTRAGPGGEGRARHRGSRRGCVPVSRDHGGRDHLRPRPARPRLRAGRARSRAHRHRGRNVLRARASLHDPRGGGPRAHCSVAPGPAHCGGVHGQSP